MRLTSPCYRRQRASPLRRRARGRKNMCSAAMSQVYKNELHRDVRGIHQSPVRYGSSIVIEWARAPVRESVVLRVHSTNLFINCSPSLVHFYFSLVRALDFFLSFFNKSRRKDRNFAKKLRKQRPFESIPFCPFFILYSRMVICDFFDLFQYVSDNEKRVTFTNYGKSLCMSISNALTIYTMVCHKSIEFNKKS